jgi:transcriptional regulator with XRE-family HTH domain
LHEIETGVTRGSVDMLKRLAEALGVLVDDLV